MKGLGLYFLLMVLSLNQVLCQSGLVYDDFEGGGTIEAWVGDDCLINNSLPNPFKDGNNTSETVLEYHDVGGQYANVRFDVPANFDLSESPSFTFKIYVPSNGITGNAPHQVSLKLQNGFLAQPWTTQTEIIKSISLNQWQIITVDFKSDQYKNFDPSSQAPIYRSDLNRVLIQVNGENNNDRVLAYIDDFQYNGTLPSDPIYDKLVWSDEFDVDGPLNEAKWFHQTQLPNGYSWYNGEIQHYTDRTHNTIVENGIMKIIARRETFTDQGETKDFTSARINSKIAFQNGRIEIRAKLPKGIGTWPALWMLGKNISEPGAYWQTQGFGNTPWPQCGEIDIMEHWGDNQDYVSSAIHSPSSFGNTQNVGGQTIPNASTEFHTYELEWTQNKMTFGVDGKTHYVYQPSEKNSDTWPFEADQYLVFNVAILPSIEASFTHSAMEIDYVRIYQESTTSILEENDSNPIKTYPNPVDSEIIIEVGEDQVNMIDARIYTNNGQLIKNEQVSAIDGKIKISDLGDLPTGIYIVNFTIGGKLNNVKFIKK